MLFTLTRQATLSCELMENTRHETMDVLFALEHGDVSKQSDQQQLKHTQHAHIRNPHSATVFLFLKCDCCRHALATRAHDYDEYDIVWQ